MKRIRSQAISAAALAVALFAVGSSGAQAQGYNHSGNWGNELRFRGGVFTPQAQGAYFDGVLNDFTASKGDFQGGAIGVDYRHEIAPLLDLSLGSSYYYADHDVAYRNFEDERGHSIIHTTRIETASFDLGLVLRLAPRGAPIVPYVGGGGTAISYRLEEKGDFINFDVTPRRIYRDHFKSQDQAYGWYAVAGLDVPLGRNVSVFGEGRWQNAHADLTDDFAGFGRLDLNGIYVTVGAAWRF